MERTAPIKFTAATVQEVAERVKRLTEGRFALGVHGSHPEHGTSYSDAHKQRTWYGPEGARQACAYYIGGAFEESRLAGWTMPEEDFAYLQRVQAAYMEGPQRRKKNMMHWEQEGVDRVVSAAEAGGGNG